MEQIKDVEKCLIHFDTFMRAAATPETVPETLRTLLKGVYDAEDTADKSLRKMIDSLSEGSFLPSTREDLIDIATSCDKVANKCETVAKIVVYQKISFTAEDTETLNQIVDITRAQFKLLEDAISMLFGKFNVILKDHSILDEIRALESKVDAIEDSLNEKIFATDAGLAEKMQKSHIIELICDVSDVIEDIADKIQIMLISRKA
jgi:predicted phosphate transport protein (TIGR00153 family)